MLGKNLSLPLSLSRKVGADLRVRKRGAHFPLSSSRRRVNPMIVLIGGQSVFSVVIIIFANHTSLFQKNVSANSSRASLLKLPKRMRILESREARHFHSSQLARALLPRIDVVGLCHFTTQQREKLT